MSELNDEVGERWITRFTNWAISLWIIQFVLALYFTTVTNLVFGIPVGQVVDVQLSLQIFFPITALILYLIASVIVHDFSDWYYFVATAIAYCLMPFTAILGYELYAYFADVDLAKHSFIYAGFLGHLAAALRYMGHVGATLSVPYSTFIGTPKFFNWSQFVFSALALLLPVTQMGINRWFRHTRQG